jgi:hypothetical protein
MAEPSSPSSHFSHAKKKLSKKSSAMKDSLENDNNPSLSSAYSSPKEVWSIPSPFLSASPTPHPMTHQVSIFRVLGFMTRKLAKEYLFAVNSNARCFSVLSLLLLAQTSFIFSPEISPHHHRILVKVCIAW